MTIASRIHQIQLELKTIAIQSHRSPDDIHLLAVSKSQSIEAIQMAYDAGIQAFGENYVQEALDKIKALSGYPIQWHFIGAIQQNKTSLIAPYFDWVHSVSRPIIAQKLNEHRPDNIQPLQVCIQVNLDHEVNKSGALVQELPSLIDAIQACQRLTLRGLMSIPKPTTDKIKQREQFMDLAELKTKLNQAHGIQMDTLSMGMSDDYEAAIAAGSTYLRLGRIIFGERDKTQR